MKRGMRPAHPGALIKETIEGLKEETGHNYTQAEIAKGLGITRKTLSNILNEHQGISSEMCVRLSEAFGTSAEFWLDIQRNYDLWHAERTVERKTIQHFRTLQNGTLQFV
ncbi:HigA family addiction module antitoxin [Dyadobacter sediminis]|uniref:HigA family addiction module antidote protein n=1 Tax=Dyadobacter sediminis TaxID=1493691 RepID=A0A5R9K8Y9_9BACT|nr:HigA family addiction module antitoxin [Dyadobacter sediminis]TLU90542.1 HigA family addiction module antidote protein [Dyadobacter sediminis]GGC08659.1 transcriptional regulator [Dyadobacter sediminis]